MSSDADTNGLVSFFDSIMADGYEGGLKIKSADALAIGILVYKTVKPLHETVIIALEDALSRDLTIGRTPEATAAICKAVYDSKPYDMEIGMPAVFGALLLGALGSLDDTALPAASSEDTTTARRNALAKSSAQTLDAFIELCRAHAPPPLKKRRAPSAIAAKKKPKKNDCISLRQSMRLTRNMPDYDLRHMLVGFFEKRVVQEHLLHTSTSYPATIGDFERVVAESGGEVNDEMRSVCQDVLRRCKSWVDFRRYQSKADQETTNARDDAIDAKVGNEDASDAGADVDEP